MIALDTNVIVRVITADSREEAERARRFVQGHDVLVSATVLLEAAWVLRNRYRLTPLDVSRALRSFAGLPRVHLQSAEEAHRALTWAEEGMDLADAIHLSLCEPIGPLATFDQDLLREARRRGVAVLEP